MHPIGGGLSRPLIRNRANAIDSGLPTNRYQHQSGFAAGLPAGQPAEPQLESDAVAGQRDSASGYSESAAPEQPAEPVTDPSTEPEEHSTNPLQQFLERIKSFFERIYNRIRNRFGISWVN